MGKGQVTISDIAREAGVAIGTVDRVLHNRGRVSAETSARVMEIVERLGYEPNKAAQILAQREPVRIAVIYPCPDVLSYFWSTVRKGVERAKKEFSQYGAQITVYELKSTDAEEELGVLNEAILKKVDGIAIVPIFMPEVLEAIRNAAEQGIMVVTFNNDENCGRRCYVGQNLYQSGRAAGKLMSFIAPQGARITAMIPSINVMTSLGQRYLGFREVLLHSRRDVELIENSFYQEENIDTLREMTREAIERTGCNAVYVSTAHVEVTAAVIEEMQLKEHIALIGHDDMPLIRDYIKKGVIDATIGQEPELQGYLPIEILCGKLIFNREPEKELFYTRIEIFIKENI